MKTDVNVKEILSRDRRKLFFLLYKIPWMICGLLFLLNSFGFYFLFFRETFCYDNNKLIIDANSNSIYREAVSLGYGEWLISTNDLSVYFSWIVPEIEKRNFETSFDQSDLKVVEENTIIRKENLDLASIRSDVIFYEEEILDLLLLLSQELDMDMSFFLYNYKNRNYREYPILLSDLDFAYSLNYDLEWSLIGNVNLAISKVFSDSVHVVDNSLLEERVKLSVLSSIRSRFDGFETWKKYNNKKLY